MEDSEARSKAEGYGWASEFEGFDEVNEMLYAPCARLYHLQTLSSPFLHWDDGHTGTPAQRPLRLRP